MYPYLNLQAVNIYKANYDLYIGRSKASEPYNKWANPFKMNSELDRKTVVDNHYNRLITQLETGEITIEEILALRGKTLGCFCYPKLCHAANFDKVITVLDNLGITNQQEFQDYLSLP